MVVSLRKTRFIKPHVLFTGVYLLKRLFAGFLPCAGLRLGVRRWFQAFLASRACAACATSYHFASIAPPPWRTAFSRFAPVVNLGLPVLASGSNRAVKPTCLRQAAYFRSLANFFNDPLIMKNILFVASAALFLSACASPARYAWVKEGASDHQRTNDTSECTYQVRLNKTPVAEQKELHSLCMQGKGYRMKRIG